MNARNAILNRVRNACGRETELPTDQVASVRGELLNTMPLAVQQRLKNPAPSTQPAVSPNLTDALITQMESVQMSVVRLQSTDDVVAAVQWYLNEQGVDGDITVSPSLRHLDWQDQVRFGVATGSEQSSVTSAFAAVAETGSIALVSGPGTPATLNFLPENHLVVLHESQIVEHLEDVWSQIRKNPDLPRAVNLVTGPSRTGDIEQTIELGAHGPRRMHVMIIAADNN